VLVIRNEQIRRFRQLLDADFRKRIGAVLGREFPSQWDPLTPVERSDFIYQGRNAAEGCGIVTEWDICRFLLYQLRLGVAFHDAPWASRILRGAGTAKMDRLDDYYFRGI
jgi:hypothetical protein